MPRLVFTLLYVVGCGCLVYSSWCETHGTYTTFILGLFLWDRVLEDYAARKAAAK